MSKQTVLGGSVAAVLMVGAGFGGMAIAGDQDGREAGPRIVAEPMAATKQGAVTRAGGAKIQTYYLGNEVVPPEGQGLVTGLVCPRGNAIGGGAATEEGIVVSYLSQLKPSNLNTSRKTYWVGVDDNSTTNTETAGAILEVHCAKGLDVKK